MKLLPVALIVAVVSLPTADAFFHRHFFAARGPGPETGDNGMHTAFGDLTAPMNATFAGTPVTVEATLRLNESGVRAARVMLAFVATNPSVRLEFASPRQNGSELPLEVDQRDASPPLVFVRTEYLRPGEPIALRARVEPTADGRHQVGALAIGYDDQWRPLRDADGTVAQLYAYTFVGARGLSDDPPFQGRGNALPLWPVPALAALGVLGLVIADAWRSPPGPGTRRP